RQRRLVMFSKTAIAIASASLAVGSAAPTPAMVNYAPCVENPAANGCPGEIKKNTATPSYRAEHHTRSTTNHHGYSDRMKRMRAGDRSLLSNSTAGTLSRD